MERLARRVLEQFDLTSKRKKKSERAKYHKIQVEDSSSHSCSLHASSSGHLLSLSAIFPLLHSLL